MFILKNDRPAVLSITISFRAIYQAQNRGRARDSTTTKPTDTCD